MTTVCHRANRFKRSDGQMMLCPEGRRHWSRWGYFHQLAPGKFEAIQPNRQTPKKWRCPHWESKGHYILLYEKMRKVYVYTGIYTIFIICPSFFLKYLISTMWQNYIHIIYKDEFVMVDGPEVEQIPSWSAPFWMPMTKGEAPSLTHSPLKLQKQSEHFRHRS